MSYLVAHLSKTPCAGAILDLAQASTRHGAPSRWIGNGGAVGNLRFPYDLLWSDSEALSVLAFANVLVLHNYLDVDDQPIQDFLDGDPSKRVAAFYHSHPDNCNLSMIHRGIPAYVVNQFQALAFEARGLPHTPIRNVIPFDAPFWPKLKDTGNPKFIVGWAPTTRQPQQGARGTRGWYDTKGFDVTQPVLDKWATERKSRELTIMEGIEARQCLQWKSECDVLIDEMVTGSFHRSTLEGLALGIPTIVHLDPRIDERITALAGGDEMPVVRCNGPDDLPAKLAELEAMKRKDRRQLGVAGREWMQRHWDPCTIAKEFAATLHSLPTWEELKSRSVGEETAAHDDSLGVRQGQPA